MNNVKKIMMAICTVLIIAGVVKCSTMTTQAATKEVVGGDSFETAKAISNKDRYVLKRKEGQYRYYYKIKTPKYSSLLTYNVRNMNIKEGIRIEVTDNAGTHGAYNNWGTFGIEKGGIPKTLKPNKWYYVRVIVYGSGNLRFSFDFKKDEVFDTFEEAKSIKCGRKYTGSIDIEGDADMYKFKTTANRNYKISIKSNGNKIYGAAVFVEFSIPQHGISYKECVKEMKFGTRGTVNIKLKKNKWYYIRIGSYQSEVGKYTFSVS